MVAPDDDRRADLSGAHELVDPRAERDGRTLLTVRDRFASKEDRDGMLESGMESGARETYERLDEVLAELKRTAA